MVNIRILINPGLGAQFISLLTARLFLADKRFEISDLDLIWDIEGIIKLVGQYLNMSNRINIKIVYLSY